MNDLIWKVFTLIIGSAGLASLITVLLTIRSQRIIAQSQIDVATKRKFIDDMLYISKEISKNIFTIHHIISELILNKVKTDIVVSELIEMQSRIPCDLSKETDIYNRLSILNKESENIDDKINEHSKGFFYHVSCIYLYIPLKHKEHETLKSLIKIIQECYASYIGNDETIDVDIKTIRKKYKQLAEKLDVDYDNLISKLQEIIDIERNNIDVIIYKK